MGTANQTDIPAYRSAGEIKKQGPVRNYHRKWQSVMRPPIAEMGKLVLNGPLLDSFATSGEICDIGVLKTDMLREVQELIPTDPVVKAGRLVFELHAWMVEKDILP